jgi:D-sedoheptulose 7-phosphate isomerase
MVVRHIGDTIAALSYLDSDLLSPLLQEVRRATAIALLGNGGSFATAEHWAVDLQRAGRFAWAIGSNGAALTAYANDDDYSDAAALELRLYGKPRDLLICLSCSGISGNIVSAIKMAKRLGVRSVLLTGTLHQDVAPADTIVRIWSRDYGVIEDCHLAIGHWLAQELHQPALSLPLDTFATAKALGSY